MATKANTSAVVNSSFTSSFSKADLAKIAANNEKAKERNAKREQEKGRREFLIQQLRSDIVAYNKKYGVSLVLSKESLSSELSKVESLLRTESMALQTELDTPTYEAVDDLVFVSDADISAEVTALESQVVDNAHKQLTQYGVGQASGTVVPDYEDDELIL